jgi:hypothetical protein
MRGKPMKTAVDHYRSDLWDGWPETSQRTIERLQAEDQDAPTGAAIVWPILLAFCMAAIWMAWSAIMSGWKQ